MTLYNTSTRSLEQFTPSNQEEVTVYACGPTVYDYAHIGNFRTYVMTDILVRTLRYIGYKVKFVMNITDVGHLVSDADTGQDKMEKGAAREGKTAWEIAQFYTDVFLEDSRKLNLCEPDHRPKPTEHIREQISMVDTLLKKGYAYRIDDGIYFDTTTVDEYGSLTGQDREMLLAGARVEVNPQKRNPLDFALWKFSPKNQKRHMEWESPWGIGFPGWHIECSVMGMKYLGAQIDIHTGGVDLIPVHHTNEIAQSEAVTGQKPFVRYWVHGQFILVDGEKMSKSKGNFYRLSDIEQRGFSPMSLRYLYLSAQYRSYLNFTWDALRNASNSLVELRSIVQSVVAASESQGRTQLSEEKNRKMDEFRSRFLDAITGDMNMPQAVASTWEMLKSNIPATDKRDLIERFDEVLGLRLLHTTDGSSVTQDDVSINLDDLPEIRKLVKRREALRRQHKFEEADRIRQKLYDLGYVILDSSEGPTIQKISN